MDNGGLFTQRLLADADLPSSATALDVGCGPGVVTRHVARAIGPAGHVLGIDTNVAMLEKARQSPRDQVGGTVDFAEQDVFAFAETGAQFDVLTCRRVLMYLPDQIAAAMAFRKLLKPGGLLILQEHDASLLHSNASLPLYEQARSWVWDTVRAEGAHSATGFDLYSVLSSAGFSDISVRAEAIVETPDQVSPLADIIAQMLPRIEAAGVATAEQIAIPTLAERLRTERMACRAVTIGEIMFGALARA